MRSTKFIYIPIISIQTLLTIIIFWLCFMCMASGILVPAAAAKSLQSCLTLCDPKDSSPPGSAVPEILQARTLEWVAISFSNAWKWKVKVKLLSRVWLLATPWTAASSWPRIKPMLPEMEVQSPSHWTSRKFPNPATTDNLVCGSFLSFFAFSNA